MEKASQDTRNFTCIYLVDHGIKCNHYNLDDAFNLSLNSADFYKWNEFINFIEQSSPGDSMILNENTLVFCNSSNDTVSPQPKSFKEPTTTKQTNKTPRNFTMVYFSPKGINLKHHSLDEAFNVSLFFADVSKKDEVTNFIKQSVPGDQLSICDDVFIFCNSTQA